VNLLWFVKLDRAKGFLPRAHYETNKKDLPDCIANKDLAAERLTNNISKEKR